MEGIKDLLEPVWPDRQTQTAIDSKEQKDLRESKRIKSIVLKKTHHPE